MGDVSGLVLVVERLKAERTNIVEQLKYVDAALAVLGRLNGGTAQTRTAHTELGHAGRPKRTLSAPARRKIAAAQRARWAKWRAAKKK